jgi:hypothetical protein
MEHVVHLAASHIMQEIAPSSAQKLLKKAKEAMKNAGIDEDLDIDQLNAGLSELTDKCDNYETRDADLGADADDDETDIDAADAIGKALALVTQVSSM